MAKALMFQGTGSDVGKTVLVAGFCRLLANRGLRVRPFKPQNMSNNAAVADDGGEIGRAQWLQALACRTKASIHMNPVLLKPQSDVGSQIIVHGTVRGQARGRDYQALKPTLLDAVLESYRHLQTEADIVLVEGAGSPAEVNLRNGDIANMGFATVADVPVVLVGDIDRGGVIASLVGTHKILPSTDRDMIVGYLINKFRGDVTLFEDGLKIITEHTGWPSFGVVPWLEVIGRLPPEDSVVLERMSRDSNGGVKIVVPVLSRIANFDDFDPLLQEPDVELIFLRSADSFPKDAALIVLPGSKSTIADMQELTRLGWDHEIRAHVARGKPVIGICGGYQILGQSIQDPHRIEGNTDEIRGLGLLDVETVMEAEKTVRNSSARSCIYDVPLSGYQIHQGETTGAGRDRPMAIIDGQPDGAVSADGLVSGTYLHGLFGSDAFRASLLTALGGQTTNSNYAKDVDQALDTLAQALDDIVDIEALLKAAR